MRVYQTVNLVIQCTVQTQRHTTSTAIISLGLTKGRDKSTHPHKGEMVKQQWRKMITRTTKDWVTGDLKACPCEEETVLRTSPHLKFNVEKTIVTIVASAVYVKY